MRYSYIILHFLFFVSATRQSDIYAVLVSKPWVVANSRDAYSGQYKNINKDRVSVKFFSDNSGICFSGMEEVSFFSWKLGPSDDGEATINIFNIKIKNTQLLANKSTDANVAQQMFFKENMYYVRIMNNSNNGNLRFISTSASRGGEALYFYFQ